MSVTQPLLVVPVTSNLPPPDDLCPVLLWGTRGPLPVLAHSSRQSVTPARVADLMADIDMRYNFPSVRNSFIFLPIALVADDRNAPYYFGGHVALFWDPKGTGPCSWS